MQRIKQRYNSKPVTASIKLMQELKTQIATIRNFKLHLIQNTLVILESLLSVQIAKHKENRRQKTTFVALNDNGK
jgi:hypothetical protein